MIGQLNEKSLIEMLMVNFFIVVCSTVMTSVQYSSVYMQ